MQLRERSFGEFEGLTKDALAKQGKSPAQIGEPREHVAERAMQAIADLADQGHLPTMASTRDWSTNMTK